MPPACGNSPSPNSRYAQTQSRSDSRTAPYIYVQHPAIPRARGRALLITAGHGVVFWPQFLPVNTALSRMAKVYGGGEHSEPTHTCPSSSTPSAPLRSSPRIVTNEISLVLVLHYPVLTMAYIPFNPGVRLVSRATGEPLQLGHPWLVIVNPIGCDSHGMHGSDTLSCLVHSCRFGCRGPRAKIGWSRGGLPSAFSKERTQA